MIKATTDIHSARDWNCRPLAVSPILLFRRRRLNLLERLDHHVLQLAVLLFHFADVKVLDQLAAWRDRDRATRALPGIPDHRLDRRRAVERFARLAFDHPIHNIEPVISADGEGARLRARPEPPV